MSPNQAKRSYEQQESRSGAGIPICLLRWKFLQPSWATRNSPVWAVQNLMTLPWSSKPSESTPWPRHGPWHHIVRKRLTTEQTSSSLVTFLNFVTVSQLLTLNSLSGVSSLGICSSFVSASRVTVYRPASLSQDGLLTALSFSFSTLFALY